MLHILFLLGLSNRRHSNKNIAGELPSGCLLPESTFNFDELGGEGGVEVGKESSSLPSQVTQQALKMGVLV